MLLFELPKLYVREFYNSLIRIPVFLSIIYVPLNIFFFNLFFRIIEKKSLSLASSYNKLIFCATIQSICFLWILVLPIFTRNLPPVNLTANQIICIAIIILSIFYEKINFKNIPNKIVGLIIFIFALPTISNAFFSLSHIFFAQFSFNHPLFINAHTALLSCSIIFCLSLIQAISLRYLGTLKSNSRFAVLFGVLFCSNFISAFFLKCITLLALKFFPMASF